MEIGAATNITNFASALARSDSSDVAQEPNAFGIGSANQPEVELSPQARILQQNEQTQNERAEALGQGQQQSTEQDGEQPEISGTDFVRISSSVGSAARNNLSTERAAEVYQSIQDLL